MSLSSLISILSKIPLLDPAYAPTLYYPSSYPNFSYYLSQFEPVERSLTLSTPTQTQIYSWQDLLNQRLEMLITLNTDPLRDILRLFIKHGVYPLAVQVGKVYWPEDSDQPTKFDKPMVTLVGSPEKMLQIVKGLNNTPIKVLADGMTHMDFSNFKDLKLSRDENYVSLTFGLENPDQWTQTYIDYLLHYLFFETLATPLLVEPSTLLVETPIMFPKPNIDISVRKKETTMYNPTTNYPVVNFLED